MNGTINVKPKKYSIGNGDAQLELHGC